MKLQKLKSAIRALCLAGFVAGALLAASPAHVTGTSANSQEQKPVLTSREILQLAGEALGGDAFFNPKPYTLNVSITSKDSYDGKKAFNRTETYKDRRYNIDGDMSFLSKKHLLGKSFPSKYISDLNSRETWQSISNIRNGRWNKTEGVVQTAIPFIDKRNWDYMVFDPEVPIIVKQKGVNYYKLNVKYDHPTLKNWHVTYLINTKDHLIYKIEQINTSTSYKTNTTYMNYVNTDDIMVPQKIINNWVNNESHKGNSETTYNNFTFRNDIPDSLFEVPTNKAITRETAVKRETNYQFKTSTAHPEWQSPNQGLENRLKDRVVDIVHNFPERHADDPESLNKLGDHIESILKTTNGRVSKQEVKWEGEAYYNVLASYGPENGPRIVIGAHYDAVEGSPGADDNASAVAVLLELAKMLDKNPPSIRVDLAAYTMEEFGTSGSRIHARALRAEKAEVKAMMSLEMVGYFSDEPKSQRYPLDLLLKWFYPSKGNFITVVGKSGSGSLIKNIKKDMARATPLPVRSLKAPSFLKSLVRTVGRSDHGAFWEVGYPAVMITDTSEFRNEHYHQDTDVPELLDYRRMAMVTVGVERAIRALCN